jgi:hypothetical protein
MYRYFILTLLAITGLSAFFTESIVLAQDGYVLTRVLIIQSGKIKPLIRPSEIKDYIECENGNEPVSITLGYCVAMNDQITVKRGANAMLRLGSGQLIWLNYDTIVRQEEDGVKLVDGEAYASIAESAQDIRDKYKLAGRRLRAIRSQTDFYLKASRNSDMDLLYVFHGKVGVKDGALEQTVSKGKAIEASVDNGIEEIEELNEVLYEPDIKRIKKWRADIRLLDFPLWKRILHWPFRHPKISLGTIAVVTSAKIIYEIGQDNSKLKVEVHF